MIDKAVETYLKKAWSKGKNYGKKNTKINDRDASLVKENKKLKEELEELKKQ